MNAVWNGQEALEYLQTDPSEEQPRPDIVLMDVQMPVMDGYQATDKIRKLKMQDDRNHIRRIPIVAMTASAIQGDRERCEKAGMDDYLAKPVNGANLEKMLVKWAVEGRKQALPSSMVTSPLFSTREGSPEKTDLGISPVEAVKGQKSSNAQVSVATDGTVTPPTSGRGALSPPRDAAYIR